MAAQFNAKGRMSRDLYHEMSIELHSSIHPKYTPQHFTIAYTNSDPVEALLNTL